MPLNWDAEKCDPAVLDGEDARMVTKAIVFATMPVGINPITERNYVEFFERVSAYEKAAGAYITTWDGEKLVERPLTLEDIRLRIGLRTNASTLTKTAFKGALASIQRSR